MENISGYTIFTKQEMNELNSITVLNEMVENLEKDIPKWKSDSGMRKILECQKEACRFAIKYITKSEL